MSTTNGGPAPGPDQATAQAGLPQLMVLAQYVKDLSFENPNAPQSLQQNVQPQINVMVNVAAKQLNPGDFEVELRLEGKAEVSGNVMFNVELVFAAAFRIQNIPQENLQPVLMIECPRLLFPFARQIVADAVRNGGFPPLFIDPIDFAGLYRQRMEGQGAPAPVA